MYPMMCKFEKLCSFNKLGFMFKISLPKVGYVLVFKWKQLRVVIIVDLTHTNVMQQTLMTTTHAMAMAIQEKTRSYTEWTLDNDFIPFAIEMYGCFHSYFDSFFTTIMCH